MTNSEDGANVKTFDDKSEGKTSIHCPKTMFTKYLILAISFGEKFKIST